MLLVLLRAGAVTTHDTLWLASKLAKGLPSLHVLASPYPTPIPVKAYDWRRAQLVSDIVLEEYAKLRRSLQADLLLALVAADAYSPGLNFVFGHANPREGVAVVYTARLEDEDHTRYRNRLLKEALHELGHLLGLNHCTNPHCAMSFSNTLAEVDYKKPMYCRNCAEKLRRRGVEVDPSILLP